MIPGAARTIRCTTGIAWRMPLATLVTWEAVVTAPMALYMMGFAFDSHAFEVKAPPVILFLL